MRASTDSCAEPTIMPHTLAMARHLRATGVTRMLVRYVANPLAAVNGPFSESRVTRSGATRTPFLENFAVDDHGMLLAVATCASTARWSFLRSAAGVNGATLQENAPEASCRLVFRCDVSPIFQSRGPVEDDGNGRGLSLGASEFVVIRKRFPSAVPRRKRGRVSGFITSTPTLLLLAYFEGAEAC